MSRVSGVAPRSVAISRASDESAGGSASVVPVGEQVVGQAEEGSGVLVPHVGLQGGLAGCLPELLLRCHVAGAVGTLRCMECTKGRVDDVEGARRLERSGSLPRVASMRSSRRSAARSRLGSPLGVRRAGQRLGRRV